MKSLIFLIGFVCSISVGFAQLAVGDIAFVQYNADGVDNFAFVTLVVIPPGEIISFTDNEAGDIDGNEGTIVWTSPPAGVSCGTVIVIDTDQTATIGTVTESNNLDLNATQGDGIIAYQGFPTSPTFITALGNEGAVGGVYSGVAEGNLPPGLTLGVNAQSLNEFDNAKYDGPVLSGNKSTLSTEIYDFSNWVGTDGSTQTFSGTFNVTSCAPCSEPTSASEFSADSPSFVSSISANVTWNIGSGDGDNKLVLMRSGSPVGTNPVDGETYTAESIFGTGQSIGSSFVVYNGNGNNVEVTGLFPGVEYFIEIFDYNCFAGQENYYVPSITPAQSIDRFITEPEVVEDFTTLCVTDNTIEFSWNQPDVGSYSGYLLVVRENDTPHAVTEALDPNTDLGDNLDYSLAATYGSTEIQSRVLYKGLNNNVTITGLTEGVSYLFRVYSFKIGSTEYRYSSPTLTNQTINQSDVQTFGGYAGDGQATINWSLPMGTFDVCWNEILIVVDEMPGINFIPTGDGLSYNANSVYGLGDVANTGYMVYKDNGTDLVITNLNNGTPYNIEVFVRNGTNWSSGVQINVTPNITTVLEVGDLAIVAMNNKIGGGEDEVCFVSFKDVNESTSIDFTDNGYEHTSFGFWGGNEGTIRMQRTGGGIIAAGTTICFQGNGNSSSDFDIYVCGVLDNDNWTVSSLNGGGILNYNVTGFDQIWFMQGGNWTGGSGTQDGSYSGRVLYGWTSSGWESIPGFENTIGSTLYPGMKCFTSDIDGLANENKSKYIGLFTPTTKLDWISRINNTNNWTGYSNDANYYAGGPDYQGSCITFPVNSATIISGTWTGSKDDQWFECANWSDFRVPDDSVDVSIPNTINDAIINQFHADADLYGGIASARNLDIINGAVVINSSSDLLKVNKSLSISGTGILYNQIGGNIEVHKNITINGNAALNMIPSGITSTLTLHGHWNNNNPGTSPNDGFFENNSLVVFAGVGTTQTLNNVNGVESFHDVTLDKGGPTRVELLGTNMSINNVLHFGTGGFIDATSLNSKVRIVSTEPDAITGYEAPNSTGSYTNNDKLVAGVLERNVMQNTNYNFPIGARPSVLSYHPLNMNITSGNGYVEAVFESVDADGERREMDYFDNTNLCGGVPTIVSYHEFSNLGFWHMDGTNPTMGYTVTLHPNASTNGPIPASDNGEYKVIKANSGTGDSGAIWPYDQTQNSGPCVTTTNYYASAESFTGFSDFAIIATIPPSVVLPIELVSFEAKTQDRDIALNWITETEINNDLFNLYHSMDGVHWENINVQNGAGNSVETLHYSFLHRSPTWGIHYYQLEQVDFDGTNTYSGIVAAEIGFNSDISLYPIPADDVLYIDASYAFDQQSIKIHNDQGQLMSDWRFNTGRIDIQGLSNGIYFITFTSLESQIVKKFIKSSGR